MDVELRLDGNAAAGLLSEIFAADPTTTVARCASCGVSGAVGAAHVYDRCPGTVLRCPNCSAVLMRVVRARGDINLELRGISLLTYHVESGA